MQAIEKEDYCKLTGTKYSFRQRSFILAILMVHLALWFATILNIPVVRQVLGFLYLTFVPGFVILRTLKIKRVGTVEMLLFSVGLSLAFVMFVGLLANEFLPYLGVHRPLSEFPITLILSGSVLLLCFLNFVVRKNCTPIFSNEKVFINTRSLVFLSLPFLSVVGVILTIAFESNFVMILVMMMALLVFLEVLLSRKFNFGIYPAALLGIATAFVLQKTLISSYIHGFDIHTEYYVFDVTMDLLRWIPITFPGTLTYSSFSSMLSTTVLPTLCSIFLGIEPTWVLRIVYPLIYSLVPIGMYQLHRTQVGKKVAFVSVFFYMANFDVFLQPTSNAKQMIAQLFYVLLFVALFSKKMNSGNMFICLILFSFGVVTSHYGTSYFILILIAIVWLWGRIHRENKRITAKLILLIFVMSFSWYIFAGTSGPFNKIVDVGRRIYFNFFEEFFSVESRGRLIRALIKESAPSFLHTISRMFFYITLFFISIGFLALLTRRAGRNFDREYRTILLCSEFILLLTIIVPGLGPSLETSRFYNLLLIFLAPLFVIGVGMFSKYLPRVKRKKATTFLILAIILPFFLFQTGIIYEIGGDPEPTTPSISIHRMGDVLYTNLGFVRESDVFASTWLSKNVNAIPRKIYSDTISEFYVLKSYGLIPSSYISRISNETSPTDGSYVYIATYYNGVVFVGISPMRAIDISNMTDFLPFSNMLYSNGLSELHYVPGNSTSQ